MEAEDIIELLVDASNDAFLRDCLEGELMRKAASTIETLRGERDEAVKLFRQRYISEDLVKLVGYALRDLNAEIETVCRLRGEADANADLKRFVHYVDHEPSLSRGAVSSIIDFAQGQMARAEKAEAEVSTLLVKLEGVEKALEWIKQYTHEIGTKDHARQALSQLRGDGPASLQKAGERDG